MMKQLTAFQYIKALGFVVFWAYLLLYCFRVGMQYVVLPYANRTFQVVAYAPTLLNPDIPKADAESTQVDKPTSIQVHNNEIQSYIKQVFGSDANKAFTLLSCENNALNPNAVNTAGNYPAGSRDIGIFQINEYWQKVNAKFLFDSTINIQIAHKIYTDSGNTFKLWTCGRRMGI